MDDTRQTDLEFRLKQLIVEACDKRVAPESIGDHETLFGDDARLELDSLDGLQLSVALEQQFGVRITDSKELRRVCSNVASMAEYLRGQ